MTQTSTSPKTKTDYVVVHPDGTKSTRGSKNAYTHAVESHDTVTGEYGVFLFSSRYDLAVKEVARLRKAVDAQRANADEWIRVTGSVASLHNSEFKIVEVAVA